MSGAKGPKLSRDGRRLTLADSEYDVTRVPPVSPSRTEFLLERVTDDEEAGAVPAEVEAKRIRIALLVAMEANTGANLLSSYGSLLLSIETLPYQNHPDYRKEWRP